MITPKDIETIRGVYRIRRLLCPHDEAAESTYHLVEGFGVTRERVLEIVEAEESRRKEILAQIRQLEAEIGF